MGLEARAQRTIAGPRGCWADPRVSGKVPSPAKANPYAPSPEAQCAQGAPAGQQGGYRPFFPFLQPPPRRPRGRSSAGVFMARAVAACAVRGVGCKQGGLTLPAPGRGPGLHPLCHLGQGGDPDLLSR